MATSLGSDWPMAGHEVTIVSGVTSRHIPFHARVLDIMRAAPRTEVQGIRGALLHLVEPGRMQIISKWGDGYKANYRGKGVSPRN